MNKVLVFDCDGTILDTFEVIEKTVYSTFKELAPNYNLSITEAHSFFGPLIDDTFKKYLHLGVDLKTWIEVYQKYNNEFMPLYLGTYPGLVSTLNDLKNNGYILTILSNKISFAIKYGLNLMHMEHLFAYIVGADVCLPKPNVEGLQKIKEKYQTSNLIMIGDSTIDIETGNNFKIPTIGVTWCKTTKKQFLEAKATRIIDSPKELLECCNLLSKKECYEFF